MFDVTNYVIKATKQLTVCCSRRYKMLREREETVFAEELRRVKLHELGVERKIIFRCILRYGM
jgi:hypothetical protein